VLPLARFCLSPSPQAWLPWETGQGPFEGWVRVVMLLLKRRREAGRAFAGFESHPLRFRTCWPLRRTKFWLLGKAPTCR